jgi:hypothetical protein
LTTGQGDHEATPFSLNAKKVAGTGVVGVVIEVDAPDTAVRRLRRQIVAVMRRKCVNGIIQ